MERQETVPSAVTDEFHRGESPIVMVAPMVVLGFAAVVAGFLVNPQWFKSFLLIPGHWFSHYVESAVLFGHPETPAFNWGIALLSTATALVGVGIAVAVYVAVPSRRASQEREATSEADAPVPTHDTGQPAISSADDTAGLPVLGYVDGHNLPESAPQRRDPLEKGGVIYALLYRKYFLDELYEGLLVRRFFYRYFVGITDWLDRSIVDGFVDFTAGVCRNGGRLLSQLQTGQVQFYGVVIVLGAVLITLGYLAFAAGLGG